MKHPTPPPFAAVSHSFNESVAKTTGNIAAAVIFNHLFFWLRTNKQKNHNQHEGRTWMYESIGAIAAHLPYLSEKQVKTGLSDLVKYGYILKGNFSQNKFDHTNWYAVADEEWLGIQKSFTKSPTGPIDKDPEGRSTSPPGPILYKDTDSKHTDSKTNKDIAQSAAPLRQEVPEIYFSFDQKQFLNITDEDLSSWKELYPSVDITRALKEMTQWVLANTAKAKAKKLWRKFIIGWLKRNHEEITNKQAYRSMKSQQTLERHTGLSKDTSPVHPSKIHDYSQETELPPGILKKMKEGKWSPS